MRSFPYCAADEDAGALDAGAEDDAGAASLLDAGAGAASLLEAAGAADDGAGAASLLDAAGAATCDDAAGAAGAAGGGNGTGDLLSVDRYAMMLARSASSLSPA